MKAPKESENCFENSNDEKVIIFFKDSMPLLTDKIQVWPTGWIEINNSLLINKEEVTDIEFINEEGEVDPGERYKKVVEQYKKNKMTEKMEEESDLKNEP